MKLQKLLALGLAIVASAAVAATAPAEAMTMSNWLALTAIIVSILGSAATATWVVASKLTKNFATLDHAMQKGYSDVDKRIYGLEKMVSPYAQDINDLEVQSRAFVKDMAELTAKYNSQQGDIDRHERELAALRDRK